jgi:hypothetical protein
MAYSTRTPVAGWLSSPPPSKILPFNGAEDTLKSMARAALGDRGERSATVRGFTEWVVRGVEPKDYLGEVLAIRNVFVQRSPWTPWLPLIRYTNDPRHVEVVKDPQRMVEEIAQFGCAVADCDEIVCLAATMCLQVGREVEFVAVGFGEGQLSHVGLRVREPKSNAWVWLDAVAGPKERQAAATASKKVFWSLD